MFKSPQPPKQNQGITVNSNVAETIIGPETKYQGTVTTSKTIRIDGVFEGEIKSSGPVIVGETGKFSGTMDCKSLSLSGLVEGNATVSEKLECTSQAILKADINVKDLILANGAIFDGKCNMSKFNKAKEEDSNKSTI